MGELAAACPVPTAIHLAHGEPGNEYLLPWSVQSWLPGAVATPEGLAHSGPFADDLVTLIRSLREADTSGRPFDGKGRGGDLRDSDEWMEICFHESKGLLPVDELRFLWGRFRVLPESGPDRMTHGDLIPGNLLVDGEKLAGVLDGGGFSPLIPHSILLPGGTCWTALCAVCFARACTSARSSGTAVQHGHFNRRWGLSGITATQTQR